MFLNRRRDPPLGLPSTCQCIGRTEASQAAALTTSVTVEPGTAVAVGSGFCEITNPVGTSQSGSDSTPHLEAGSLLGSPPPPTAGARRWQPGRRGPVVEVAASGDRSPWWSCLSGAGAMTPPAPRTPGLVRCSQARRRQRRGRSAQSLSHAAAREELCLTGATLEQCSRPTRRRTRRRPPTKMVTGIMTESTRTRHPVRLVLYARKREIRSLSQTASQ